MRSILPRTIQARLILSHLLVSLVSIIMISAYAGGMLFNALYSQVRYQYQDVGLVTLDALQQPFLAYRSGSLSQAELEEALQRIARSHPGFHYTIFLPDGSPVVDSSGALPPAASPASDPEIWQALSNDIARADRSGEDLNGTRRLYIALLIEDGGQVSGVLRLDAPLDVAISASRRSLWLLIATALVVALGMGGVGYFLARSLAEPIEHITQASERLAQGELGVRVTASQTPTETFTLAQAFNMMADRMQLLVGELRSFVANASHELRTPLTAIKLRVEALRSGALDDPPVTERFLAEIESEVDRLSKMVSDLLDLSRIESGLDTSKHLPMDVGAIVSEVYETFSVRADRAGLKLSLDMQPDLPEVLGNEDQLRRMLYNLVENAIKYTGRGGEVALGLQRSEDEDSLRLSVRDTGFGIAPAQLPHVFERFYRVEATRPRYSPSQGSGLGLSIAKSIAEAHGGKIGVTSQVGAGSTFWVELPVLHTP
jgi:signal transduction histidine kinase